MEAMLVVLAIKIVSAKLMNLSIVPPEQANDGDVHNVCYDDLAPVRVAPDIRGRDHGQPLPPRRADICLPKVDWDNNAAADYGQNQKHVPAHARKTEEYGRIQSNVSDQITLSCLPQRKYPRPGFLPDRRGSVLLVGMFELRRVDCLIVWSKEGEADGYKDSKPDCDTESSPDGGLLELDSISSQLDLRGAYTHGIGEWILQ